MDNFKKSTNQIDILIIGGGMAGLTLATLLGQLGLKTGIVDPVKPDPGSKARPGTRTVALMQNSINILKAANVWENCIKHSAPLKTMRIIDDSTDRKRAPVQIEFEAAEIGLDVFGYNIPNAVLQTALVKQVCSLPAIHYYAPASLVDYQPDKTGVLACLDDGTEMRASLIIGADGRNSATRKIANIPCRSGEYGQQAITCLIEHSKPHDNVSTEFHRPSGPFALVPLPGNKSSLVWVEKTEDARAITALKKQDFEQALQDRTNDLLGQVKLVMGPNSWPLQWLKAKRLTAPRTAILAESAHSFSPIGAQGLNLSLRDIASLAETIADAARLGQDIGCETVLNRYEKRRRTDISTRIMGVNTLNKMISNDFGLLRDIRRLGLRTLDNIPQLKRAAMHQGLAPHIDESRLAQGKAL